MLLTREEILTCIATMETKRLKRVIEDFKECKGCFGCAARISKTSCIEVYNIAKAELLKRGE